MNDPNPAPSHLPPQIPAVLTTPARLEPLGQTPEEREPIPHVGAAVEALLRQPRRVMYQLGQPGTGRVTWSLLALSAGCSLIYGLIVGTFSMGTQLWAAPLKMAGGLLITTLICLPSLHIFTCLSGSQARLGQVCGWAAGLLSLMTILLIGFAPVAWLFSQSTQSVAWMGALHLAFWLISTLFGLRFLQVAFSHSQVRSRAGLNTWTVIFVLVALQMTTALRPILGTADTLLPQEKKLFLTHWGDCLKGSTQARTPAR